MLICPIGPGLALWRLNFLEICTHCIRNAQTLAFYAFSDYDACFAGIKFNGFTPCLLQNFARILDTLATPNTLLVPFNVIGAFGVALRIAVHQNPILLQLVIL